MVQTILNYNGRKQFLKTAMCSIEMLIKKNHNIFSCISTKKNQQTKHIPIHLSYISDKLQI